MTNPLAARFQVSNIDLPPESNPRDKAVADLAEQCERILKVASDKRESVRALESLKTTEKPDIEKIIAAAQLDGLLEERLYNAVDKLNADLRTYNQRDHFGICVAYTRDGLPIRVDKARKVPLWGF